MQPSPSSARTPLGGTPVDYTRTGRVRNAKKGLKVHNCECGRSYTRAEHLRRHQKNHMQMEWTCEFQECGRTFLRLDLLQRHQERHNKIKRHSYSASYIDERGPAEPDIPDSVPVALPPSTLVTTASHTSPYHTKALSSLPADKGINLSERKMTPYTYRTSVAIPVTVDGLPNGITWSDPFIQSPSHFSSSEYASPNPGDYTNMFADLSRSKTSTMAQIGEDKQDFLPLDLEGNEKVKDQIPQPPKSEQKATWGLETEQYAGSDQEFATSIEDRLQSITPQVYRPPDRPFFPLLLRQDEAPESIQWVRPGLDPQAPAIPTKLKFLNDDRDLRFGIVPKASTSEGNTTDQILDRIPRGNNGQDNGVEFVEPNRGGSNDRNEYRQRTTPTQQRQPSPGRRALHDNRSRFIEWNSNIPHDHIQVLSRTLFVDGASGTGGEIGDIFSRFGKVQVCFFNQDERQAFIRMETRRDAVAAKAGMDSLQDSAVLSKAPRTLWSTESSPEDCTDFITGTSVTPISRLSNAELKLILSAEYGGTGRQPLEEGMVIEEPEIKIIEISDDTLPLNTTVPRNLGSRRVAEWQLRKEQGEDTVQGILANQQDLRLKREMERLPEEGWPAREFKIGTILGKEQRDVLALPLTSDVDAIYPSMSDFTSSLSHPAQDLSHTSTSIVAEFPQPDTSITFEDKQLIPDDIVDTLTNIDGTSVTSNDKRTNKFEDGRDLVKSQVRRPPVTQEADQGVPVVPLSDSGYGTASYCSNRVTQLAILNDTARVDAISPTNHPNFSQVPESHSDLIDSDTDDTKTVYSDAMSISDLRIESYVSGLAEDLFRKLNPKVASDQVIERLSTALPELLKALAFKFGFEAPSQMHRDVMFFIHKHRNAITESFKGNYSQMQESYPEFDERPRGDTPSKEVMSRWLESNDDLQFEECSIERIVKGDDSLDDDILEEDEEFNISGLEEYREFICNDPAYRWLLDRLRREMLLSRPEQDVMNNIRDVILQASPSTRRISRKKSSQGSKVIFCIDWDPFTFLDEQDFGEPDAEAIANAVTLTGCCKDAQALSCREYLAQTWPSTGSLTIQLIQELLQNRGNGVKTSGKTPNGTTLSASLHQSCVVVEASGVPDFVAEIGEQLAWLGSALRTSPCALGVVYCVPFIDSITPLISDENSDDCIKELQCDIKFKIEECEDAVPNANGQCWHALFRRPVIARGFPIPRRPEIETGLEIPLNMLAALTRTRYIDTFNSKVFIKGFSSMLVPTKTSDEMLVWHLLYNKSPNHRISYLDCNVEYVDVEVADLERSRHIVGWCSESVCNVGSLAANYSISKSNLPNTHSIYALEQAQISGGQFITGTAIFSLGYKEKPVHISRFGYMTKIQWISSKYVNFWDEGEKRGWLVNGASALLHLLRASLAHSKRKFKSAFLLDPNDLPDTDNHGELESAIEILMNEKNRDLKLYVDKSEVFDEEIKDKGGSRSRIESKRLTRYYRLEDRIEHIYNMLEKLIDHQADLERKSGLQINPRPRRQLEGWDFRDLVTDGDPFFPRVATIQAIGKGWVDFTRAIHAVTLFGRGFGDLIQPKRTACLRWSSLPIGRYYLAACVSDLEEIIENDGDSTSNPMKLCDNVLWYMKQNTFQPCPCNGGGSSKHHDPVQALFPSKFRTMLRKKSRIGLKDGGAVIFGHNANLHWHWKDNGDPVKGDPPQDSQDFTDSFNDSGLGSSFGSFTSQVDSMSGSSGSKTPPLDRLASFAYSDTNTSQMEDSGLIGLNDKKLSGSKRPLKAIMSSISKRRKF